MSKVVLLDGIRTPFVKSGALFSQVHPVDLGVHVVRELMLRMNWSPNRVDEMIFGNVGSPSDAANISRVVALKAGLPLAMPASTVHRNCASALESATTAYDRLLSASANEMVIAGGVESMSFIPMVFKKSFSDWLFMLQAQKTLIAKLKMLKKFSLKFLTPRIALMEGLTDPFENIVMGLTAEILVKEFGISRDDQDEFALKSHQKALAAEEKLAQEIVPYIVEGLSAYVDHDKGPRKGQSLEALAKLRPYFDKKHGSVTVGNSCPITDGAVALAFTTEQVALRENLKPLAVMEGYAYAGLDPKRMGLGPVYASYKVLKKLNLSLQDMDLVELNEAFAGQVIACQKAMLCDTFCKQKLGADKAMGELDFEKTNVNGGAIALGHPVGATGSRLILTLAKEMRRRGVKYGLATLCIGGGQGGAVVLRNSQA